VFELAASFALLFIAFVTLGIPHQVGKYRQSVTAKAASGTLLLNALMAEAIYYIWWHHSHTELRLIFTVVLWALLAFDAIMTVAWINKPRKVLTGTKAAMEVTVHIALLVMIVYLVAT
jgi:hypothetical protein